MNTYTILEAKRDELMKKMAHIEKKAQKYGLPFTASYGEPYAVDVVHTDDAGQKSTQKYEVFDLALDCDVVKKGDYTVLARLEHTKDGNVVDVLSGDMMPEWVHKSAFCEHCNSNHNLKYTFIVSDGHEVKQVGRSCLKDYCGIDPQMIAMMNEFVGELDEYTPEGYDFDEPIPCVFDAVRVLALAIDITDEQGYVKSDEHGSNKSMLGERVGAGHPSTEAMAKAEKMAEQIRDMDTDEAIDAMVNNVKIRLAGWYCKPSDFGYFAYAPTAMKKYAERKAKMERKAKEKESMSALSHFVGTVGERIVVDVKEASLLTSFETYYGTTFLYRFIDVDDNVLIWFSSTTLDVDKVKKIKATVKDHSERDGVKQTIVTRVKVA